MNRLPGMVGVAFAVSMTFGPVVADAHGPSLNETLAWLQEQINTKANNGNNGPCVNGGASAFPCLWHYQATDFTGCQVTWVFSQISNVRSGLETEVIDEITIPLWEDFSPAPVAINSQGEGWKVVLQFKDFSSERLRLKRTVRSGNAVNVTLETRSFTEINLGVPGGDNKDAAERLARGFSHAIQLCQNRKPRDIELF